MLGHPLEMSINNQFVSHYIQYNLEFLYNSYLKIVSIFIIQLLIYKRFKLTYLIKFVKYK